MHSNSRWANLVMVPRISSENILCKISVRNIVPKFFHIFNFLPIFGHFLTLVTIFSKFQVFFYRQSTNSYGLNQFFDLPMFFRWRFNGKIPSSKWNDSASVVTPQSSQKDDNYLHLRMIGCWINERLSI